MLAAIVSQVDTGVADLTADQFYFMGELLCAMSSAEITSLATATGYVKFWYVVFARLCYPSIVHADNQLCRFSSCKCSIIDLLNIIMSYTSTYVIRLSAWLTRQWSTFHDTLLVSK